jgi:hypothetical protein
MPSLKLELDTVLTELLELIELLELLLATALLEEASLLLEGSTAISEDEEMSTFCSGALLLLLQAIANRLAKNRYQHLYFIICLLILI